jgi:hypothetical protein
MSEVVGENYGDNHSEQEAPEQQGTQPGEGRNDAPATTGTHRGWGDPQTGESQPGEDKDAS